MRKRSNKRKSHAEKMEKNITAKLNKHIGNTIHINSSYDILIDLEIPLEVKCSELVLIGGYDDSGNHVRNYRRPYFKITNANHRELLEKKGWYCFIITYRGKIILDRFIMAIDTNWKENKKEFGFIGAEVLYTDKAISYNQFKKEIMKLREENKCQGEISGKDTQKES